MSAIGPGDWVERDPDFRNPRRAIPKSEVSVRGGWPEFGKLYQVRDMQVLRGEEGCLWQGLRLVGVVATISGHPDAYWPAEGFRPIYRPKADLIESLKVPAERVDA